LLENSGKPMPQLSTEFGTDRWAEGGMAIPSCVFAKLGWC
jgi:hypothetical protein